MMACSSVASCPQPPLVCKASTPSLTKICASLSFCNRRQLFGLLLANCTLLQPWTQQLAAAAPFPMMVEPDLPRFRITDAGVRIQDVVEGEGAAAIEGDLVEFNYVCRRSNGYFVYSTVDLFTGESSPVILPLDSTKMIAGLQKVLLGMKPGGKRRAVIPPAAGYINRDLQPQPKEFGPLRSLLSHSNEPLLFEVQLLKIK